MSDRRVHRVSKLACAIATVILVTGAARAAETPAADPPTSRATLFGVSSFPFAATDAAATQTFRLAAELSDLTVVQLDDGVPWAEAMSDAALPAEAMRKWDGLLSHAAPGRPVYLALEPLAADRVALAPASAGSSVPRALRGAAFDDPAVAAAYLAYARRAVRYFRPAYLNLGVESGEMAHRRPAAWPAYATMIERTMTALRDEFPGLRMGISFGLQSLMEPATAARARGLIEASDYVGLSFYPYMSPFQEKFGTAGLPPPPEQWRKPLDWIRGFTAKPIAICETGYSAADVALPQYGLRMHGSAALQAEYVRDLAAYAARDRYAFVVYYLPIDIGPLLDTLPQAQRDEGNMWRENGLLDAGLNPKPAAAAWRAILVRRYVRDDAPAAAAAPAPVPPPARPLAPERAAIGFHQAEDLCQAPAPSRVALVDADPGAKAMLWEYTPDPGAWTWCARALAPGAAGSGLGMRFRVRADADRAIVLELKAADGDGYYATVRAGPGWRDVTLDWRDFAAETGNARKGGVEPDRIVKFVLADDGKTDGAKGQPKRLWMADWVLQ